MLDRLRKRIGLFYAKVHFREPDKVLTFTDAVKRARSAMVILPSERTHTEMSRPLIQFIQRRFLGGNLTVIVPDEARSFERQLPRCDVIHLRQIDIGSFALPKKSIIHRIQRNEYDLVLDLNLEFSLPAAYLCKASRSRLRVGFATEYADTFYNFQIKRDAARNVKTVYERFAACLGMF
jgi:ADP-heptose:LPS heptosyltransferase